MNCPLSLLTSSAGLVPGIDRRLSTHPMGSYAAQLNNLWGFGFIFFPGVTFGLTVSSCLALRGYLRDPWEAIVITAVFGLSYYLSIRVAGTIELNSPFGRSGNEVASVSKSALFAGGLVGAFLVVGALSVLLNSHIAWERRVLKGIYWSPVGGILGVLRWAPGPFWEWSFGRRASLGLTAPTKR